MTPMIDELRKSALFADHQGDTDLAIIMRKAADELVIAESQLTAIQGERDAWKDAVIDAAIVNWTYAKEHEADPRKAVNALLWQAQQEALDPAISEPAAKLVQRAESAEAELSTVREALKTALALSPNSSAVRLHLIRAEAALHTGEER